MYIKAHWPPSENLGYLEKNAAVCFLLADFFRLSRHEIVAADQSPSVQPAKLLQMYQQNQQSQGFLFLIFKLHAISYQSFGA